MQYIALMVGASSVLVVFALRQRVAAL